MKYITLKMPEKAVEFAMSILSYWPNLSDDLNKHWLEDELSAESRAVEVITNVLGEAEKQIRRNTGQRSPWRITESFVNGLEKELLANEAEHK